MVLSGIPPMKMTPMSHRRLGKARARGSGCCVGQQSVVSFAQDYRRQPSFGKTTPRTEYYQIGGQQDVAEGCACFRFDITCHWLWNRTPPVRPREGKTVPWVLENFDAVQHPKL